MLFWICKVWICSIPIENVKLTSRQVEFWETALFIHLPPYCYCYAIEFTAVFTFYVMIKKKVTILLGTESEIVIRKLCMLKNKHDLMLCQSRLHTASETFVCHKKKIGSGSVFCVFASVTRFFLGKDDEYEKMHNKFRTRCAKTFTQIRSLR